MAGGRSGRGGASGLAGRRGLPALLLACALTLAPGCDDAASAPLSVGAFNFPESLILAEVYAQALQAAGVPTTDVTQLAGREGTFPALESGDVDLLPEYNGNALDFITGDEVTDTDPAAITAELRARLAPRGLVALDSSPAENRDQLVVTAETADTYDLETVGDLQAVADQLVVGGPVEFAERNTGLPGLRARYGIEFAEFVRTDAGGMETVAALRDGVIDVARLFSTDPLIDEHGWVVLAEDRPFSLPNSITPVLRADVLTDDIAATINKVSAALTTEDLVEFNRRFTLDGALPETIARDFLAGRGLP